MVVNAVTRRGMLKLLPSPPFIPHIVVEGETKSAAVKLTPRFYILFFDAAALDITTLMDEPVPVPDVEMELVALHLRPGQSLEEAVKIYEVSGPS
jgi:hypothetical protein